MRHASLALMARKWSNLNIPGALHFVTGNFLDRIPVFKQDPCCQCFINNLATQLKDWPCKIIAYVMMPDHFHMIVNPKDGRIREFTGKTKESFRAGDHQDREGHKFQIGL
jgi:REP element-mobilizing transposase RayT